MGSQGRQISLLSARDIGDHNRASVLRALAVHGPLSRSELARLSGVGRGSVGAIVQRLIDDSVLRETEPVTNGSVGKPARPVWFAPGAGSVVALETGSAGVRMAVIDARGQVADWDPMPIDDPDDPASVGSAAVDAFRRALTVQPDLLGVGVAVPGSVDATTGEVLGCTQVPGAVGMSLSRALRQASGMPVLLENDSRAQALAELSFGTGRRRATFATVRTGTGIGVGIVLDGAVLRGSDGRAPEAGHHAVAKDGDLCVCGLRGCWETIGSLRWLRRLAGEMGLDDADTMTCGRLGELVESGDDRAERLWREYAANLGQGIANLRQMVGVDTFVLHGDAVGGGEAFRERVEVAACERAIWPLTLELTELDERATLLGAASLVQSEFLHRSTD